MATGGTSQPGPIATFAVLGEVQLAIDKKGNSKNDIGRCKPDDPDGGVAGKQGNIKAGIKPEREVSPVERGKQRGAFVRLGMHHEEATALTVDDMKELDRRKIHVIIEPNTDNTGTINSKIKAWLLGVKAKDGLSLDQQKFLLEHQLDSTYKTLNEIRQQEIINIKMTRSETKCSYPVKGIEFTPGGRKMRKITIKQFLQEQGERTGCFPCSTCCSTTIYIPYKEDDKTTKETTPLKGGSSTKAPIVSRGPGSVDIIIP